MLNVKPTIKLLHCLVQAVNYFVYNAIITRQTFCCGASPTIDILYNLDSESSGDSDGNTMEDHAIASS